MIDVDVEMDADDEARINRMLNGLAMGLAGHSLATGGDLRSLLGLDVLPYLQRRARQRFDYSGDDASGRWMALRASTIKYRKSAIKRDGLTIRPHAPINVRTGALRRFATTTFDLDSKDTSATLTMPSKRGVTRALQSKLRHAQKGGVTARGVAFPARPVAALGASDKTVIDRLVVNWVEDMLKALR